MSRITFAAVAATFALVAAGCSTGTTPADDGPPHNEADVSFSQMMIPHHEQAIEMSRLAATRADSDEVKQLALDIEAAQDPEIETMRGWLKEWGADETSHDMTHDEMPGMMSDDTMAELESATGAEFDRLFLTSMIAHHEGAIAMATAAKTDGVHSGTADLASAIIKAQQAEITTMRELLGS